MNGVYTSVQGEDSVFNASQCFTVESDMLFCAMTKGNLKCENSLLRLFRPYTQQFHENRKPTNNTWSLLNFQSNTFSSTL